jgi:ribosomal protein S18 acetylase RimI-like enzyme
VISFAIVLTGVALDHISTLPSHQRRGVGALLLRSGIAQADAAGLPTIVMATPVGLGLYEKNGFERVSTIKQDDSKYGGTGSHINHFLIRKPVAKA